MGEGGTGMGEGDIDIDNGEEGRGKVNGENSINYGGASINFGETRMEHEANINHRVTGISYGEATGPRSNESRTATRITTKQTDAESNQTNPMKSSLKRRMLVDSKAMVVEGSHFH